MVYIYRSLVKTTMGVLCTLLVILISVLVGNEILKTGAMFTGLAPHVLPYSFDKLDLSSPRYSVIALSTQSSKLRCAAACAAAANCQQFCYESATRRCMLEDPTVAEEASGYLEHYANCYKKTPGWF